MKAFKDISIRYKIILIVMLIFITIAGVTFTVISINELSIQKEILKKDALLIAKYTAKFKSASLFFGIAEETSEIFETLDSNDNILFAAIYNQNGFLTHTHNPNNFSIPNTLSELNSNNHFEGSEEINLKNNVLIVQEMSYQDIQYGNIALYFSLEDALKTSRKNIRSALLFIVSMLFLVLVLIFLLQKVITKPILYLTTASYKIKEEADYSVRLEKTSNDEIGVLAERFNNLLEQIELRDKKHDETENMLKEAKFSAENADKLKSAFLANMSHEIRTPMNSIIGFVSLLADDDITKNERIEFTELINSNCNTLLHLIDDILDISKIEAGQINIEKSMLNISKILQELFITFKEINFNNNIDKVKLRLSIPPKLENMMIESDEIRLKQIISNLLSNAIKFTQDGIIELGVTLIEKIKNHKGEKYVKFYVHDTGIGIDKQTQTIIFDRFTKIESDNNKLFRGAGLGLTISKKLVELLNGHIWMESIPGKGSSFYFTIPGPAIKHEEKRTTSTKNKSSNHEIPISLDKKNVLIVEDDRSNYEVLKAILKKTKASVSWAKNGFEAINICTNEQPDLIFMDIKMPDMDGYETFNKLREMKIKTPIVAQTAYARLEDEHKILNSGFDAYLSKPIEKNKLFVIINEIFSIL